MINQKKIKIESRQDCDKHKLPICVVVWDKKLDKNDRLFCSECKCKELCECNSQNKRREEVSNVIMMSVLQIEKLEKSLNILKQGVVQRLDKMIEICGNWINNLYQLREQSKVIQNLIDELDSLINETKVELDLKLLIQQINKVNKSQENKIIERLEQFQEFEETKQCVEQIRGIDQIYVFTKEEEEEEESLDDNQQYELTQVRDDQEQLKQTQIEQNIEFNLINDQNNQKEDCQVIVFNKSGSIMISSRNESIKIWDYNQGQLKLLNTYWHHKSQITCLVYSKKRNSFVSGSDDKTIICWQQKDQDRQGWFYSYPYHQHTGYVNCLLLNQDEDLLFSGGSDKSINIWHSNFNKNQLIYLYSLKEHSRTVLSLTLNQSETLLASCGYQEFIIWGKTNTEKEKFEVFKQASISIEFLKYAQLPQSDKLYFSKSQQKLQIPNGCKLQFITDSQFIWVTDDKSINQILVFELQGDQFILQNDKTISLIENSESDDQYYFPIIYNQDKQLILIRHKHHIYLIKKLQDGKFNILASKNCGTAYNYGAMTDDAKYLVLWDKNLKKYQSFEITYYQISRNPLFTIFISRSIISVFQNNLQLILISFSRILILQLLSVNRCDSKQINQ